MGAKEVQTERAPWRDGIAGLHASWDVSSTNKYRLIRHIFACYRLVPLVGQSKDGCDIVVLKCDDALGFLSTRELVQLLPVYLRSVVEEGLVSPVLEAVLVKLTRPKSVAWQARYDALLAALSPAQRAATAAALQHIVEQDPNGSIGRDARAAKENVEGRVA